MDPIPQTTEAVEEYGPFEDDLLETLQEKGAAVRQIVPSCVGLSLGSIVDGITYTLVASAEEIALLDAVQYAAGGPYTEAVNVDEVVELELAGLDEADWHLFARATAAHNISSSLTLPILTDAGVAGSVNLYATDSGAFTGHHEDIAAVFGAWAAGAVTNADLAFETRRTAEEAPALLRADFRLEVAAAILANLYSMDAETAKARVQDAAVRAGITPEQVSETIIALSDAGRV